MSRAQLSLTSAGVELAPQLADIHAQTFAQPWSAPELARIIAGPGAFALAAVMDTAVEPSAENVQGFLIGRALAGEGEILTLAVRPATQRLGLGRTLVEAAVLAALAFSADVLWLEVAVDNTAGLALYERCGFETAGRRKAYYARSEGQRVDALVMRRRLNTAAPSAYVGTAQGAGRGSN